MTLTADSKKRVVLPGAAPGDVFTCERKGPEFVLRRVHRAAPQKKRTKAEILKDPKLEECPEHSLGGPAEDHAGTMILLDTNVIIDAHYGVRGPTRSGDEPDFVCGQRSAATEVT